MADSPNARRACTGARTAALWLLLTALAAPETGAGDKTPRRGELLLGELGCVACHTATPAARTRLQPSSAPRLDRVGERLTPQYLRALLDDPRAALPRGTMPDVLGQLGGSARAGAVESLVHYLASLGGPLDQAPIGAYAGQLESGRQLYHEVGCVACHGPQETLAELDWDWAEATEAKRAELRSAGTPDEERHTPEGVWNEEPVAFGDLGRKTTVEALARFLVDPHAVRPSGRMPSLGLGEEEARSIAMYLLRAQAWGGEREPEVVAGLAYDYFEGLFPGPAAEFGELTPVRTGAVGTIDGLPEHRPDNFGFRFSGSIRIDDPGEYTFTTASDDGSRLRIDGELVVINDGCHGVEERSGKVNLSAGEHPIVVTMFEYTGGEALSVWWEGPGFARQPLPAERLTHTTRVFEPLGKEPFHLDPARVEEGRTTFEALGCGACHDGGPAPGEPSASPLAALRTGEGRGCLAPAPAAHLPRYDLDEVRRESLRAALAWVQAEDPPAAVEELDLSLARFRCLACHRRGEVGGPHPDRRDFFFIRGGFDLGDEGRIPPHLSDAGSKLTGEWMRGVLFEGATSRPYMATRMPQFGIENIGHLPALFTELDDSADREAPPSFDLATIEDGRRLVGTGGLGCIQCHTFAGYDSLGIPAVDLAETTAHVRFGWFRKLLLDPIAINMNTRMPEFWVEGRSPVADVLDGDPERQITAMWNYLRLGTSMPLPDGLVVPEGRYELVVGDEPRLCGVFMAGVSPRTLAVGFGVHTHYAFDVQNSRLAKVWRGRFFNARGTWHARAGELESPPDGDVLDMPPGPPFAMLEKEDSPWPTGESSAAGYSVLGRRFDPQRRPIFRYAVGPVEVEELIAPQLREDGSWIVRTFSLRSKEPVDSLWFRPGGRDGEVVRVELERDGDGFYSTSFQDAFTW
ncbi:MAG: PA14 domain-containing protein [Planctomycetota bacterium]|nr:PA14 domain-containing protein [Planctomycetota bacterium]